MTYSEAEIMLSGLRSINFVTRATLIDYAVEALKTTRVTV